MARMTTRAREVRILQIDLSSGKVEKQDLGTEMREKYLGSRGVNARILYDTVGPGTDAFSPSNILIFGTGVFAGTGIPGSTRMSIATRSPHCVYGYSNVGGHFAPQIRKAGYDHILIKGKADKPVFLWINDDKVEIRSAAHLWGKGVFETDRLIKEELGDPNVRIAAIGPAGERRAAVSNVVIDKIRGCASKSAGVMSSKNLKAIALRGTGEVDVADKQLVRELSQNLIKRIKAAPFYEMMTNYTAAHSPYMFYQVGTIPIKNLSTCVLEGGGEGLSLDNLAKYFTKKATGCPGCPLSHHPMWEIKEGPYAGSKGQGSEGGPAFSYGYIVGNDYFPGILKAVQLNNDYGIDVQETAYAIALAMELYEKGIITKNDLDGIDLKWGDHQAVIDIIHKIGRGEGVGDLLGKGQIYFAEQIGKGAKEYMAGVGKNRISAWMDYRVLRGGYLNEVTSTPACEMMDGWPGAEEMVKSYGFATPEFEAKMLERYGNLDTMDPLSYKKAQSVIYNQDFALVIDMLELCFFIMEWTYSAVTLKDAADLFPAVTGIDMSEKEMRKVAVRVRDLERAYWVREGYTRKDDRLEGKIVNNAVPDGPHKGEKLDKAKIEKMLDEYYQMRGWDIKTGIPTKKKLLEDGLADVVKDLEKRGVILA